MATTETTNLHLVKPGYDELADIQVINGNMDTIDEAIGNVQDSLSSIGKSVQDINSAAVSVPNNTWTAVAQVNLTPGNWIVNGGAAFGSNASGVRSVGLTRTSGDPSGRQVIHAAASSGGGVTPTALNYMSLTANTTVRAMARQTSGSALQTYGFIVAVRVG